MSTRSQVVAAALIAATTYFVLLRIAEAKVESAAGGAAFPLDEHRGPELAAFQRLRSRLAEIGEGRFADRLEGLRRDGVIWMAPSLGPGHWAIFAEALRLVRRIYVRRLALLDPHAHLYPGPPPDIPAANRHAFAWLSLAGALRHELAHHDGLIDEREAYAAEIDWYEGLRRSSWFASLEEDQARVFDWALASAVRTARSAADRVAH